MSNNIETTVLQKIRLQVGGRPDVRIFRNNCGVAVYPDGSTVPYGLCPGSSDLIGWRSVIMRPEMVGKRLAIFVAIEVKAPGARTAPNRLEKQTDFLAAVRLAGGLAGFAIDSTEALDIVEAL